MAEENGLSSHPDYAHTYSCGCELTIYKRHIRARGCAEHEWTFEELEQD